MPELPGEFQQFLKPNFNGLNRIKGEPHWPPNGPDAWIMSFVFYEPSCWFTYNCMIFCHGLQLRLERLEMWTSCYKWCIFLSLHYRITYDQE